MREVASIKTEVSRLLPAEKKIPANRLYFVC